MAASKSRLKVEGVAEVSRALKRLEADAADLKQAHNAVAAELVPGISMRSPRRTGALAGSWSANATKTRARLRSSVAYAGVIEYGWAERGIEAARMVADTIEAEQATIISTYERELERLGKHAGFETR